MITFQPILIEKKEVAPGIFFLTFQCREGKTLSFVAGQYVIVSVPDGEGEVKRLYSIASSARNQNQFSLLVKHVEGGLGSGYLSGLTQGQLVKITGPAGLFSLQQTPYHKLFFATGTGIAPMISFLLTYDNISCSLFWGLKTMKDVYFVDFFNQLTQKNPRFNFQICLSREPESIVKTSGKPFFSGRINEAFESYTREGVWNTAQNPLEYYICGSRTVVEGLKNNLLALGVKKEYLFFEKY